MNELKKPDFFPATEEELKELSVSYQDTVEDLAHEEYLRELEARIYENSDAKPGDRLGELPYDREADKKRWDELEQDFDRLFEDSAGTGKFKLNQLANQLR